MATIAELVVRLTGDNTNLREMFADSAQRAVGMTTVITDAMEMAGKNAQRQAGMGALAAKSFIESMERSLQMDLARIKADQYALFITPAEAEQQAGQAALAFNDTLLQTLGNLRASGHLTSTLEIQLTEALQKSGLKAGIALQEAVAQGMAEGQAIARGAAQTAARGTFTAYTQEAEKGLARTNLAITNQGGAWTSMGRRGATAVMGLGFAIEQMANGSESGMRRALRSVESFAIFFGPEGLLVAGIITAGLAIFDHFHKIEKAIDDALNHAVQAASQAANAMDQVGLMKALRDIQQGQATSVDPNTHELIVNKRSQFAQNAFEGSGSDLEARLADVDAKIVAATHDHNVALVGKLTTEANDLEKKLQPMRDRYKQISDLILNPPAQMRMPEAPKPIEIKGKSSQEQATEATKAYYESLGILVTRLDAARTRHQDYANVLNQILEAYGKLGTMTAVISGASLPGEKPEDLKRRLDMIKELYKALQDIGTKVNVNIQGPDINKMLDANMQKFMASPMPTGAMGEQEKAFDQLIASIEIYRNNIELTNMDLKAHGQAIIDIDQALTPLREQAVGMAEDMRKALRAAGLDPAIVDLIVQHWLEGLNKIGAGADKTASKLQHIADIMSKAGEAANAAGDLNTALRGQQSVSNVLSSVGSAATSIGTAVASGGTDVAADIQALTSVINVGNSLTASAREIALEHKEMLKLNNERLSEVSMRLVGFAVSANTSEKAQQALAALFASHSALSQLASGATHTSGLFGSGHSGDLQTQIDALLPFLKSVGLTFEQFKKIAADNGFEIFDKEGRLVTDTLEQMRDSMTAVIRSLFTFQNTLADQKSLSDLQAKLSGAEDTPQAQANRDLALIQKLAPNLLPAGASAQGGENQDALRKMLQDLLQRIAAGTVNPADFGGFQNLQELIGVIDQTAGALNELRNVTNGVTASLENVPTGFKLALAEFDAQDAVTRAMANGPGWEQGIGMQGGLPTVNLTVEAGAITIDSANKSASEIGQETLENLKSLAGQKLGNRARWSEMV